MAKETTENTKPTFTRTAIEKEYNDAAGRVVENIDITRAANGFSARVRYAQKRKSIKSNEAVPYEEPETRVFEDIESLLGWLTDVLG